MKTVKNSGRYGKTPKRFKGACNNDVNQKTQDPVEVYCRIRPVIHIQDKICITLTSPTAVTLNPPDSSRSRKVLQYGFKHVFTEHSTQKELFEYTTLPLLEGLTQGKNGLLFTYGVTSSGKTFTMTGEPNDPGLMPRCINIIFNTIGEHQTPKYVIKSDKMNGFEIQSPSDALTDRIREAKSRPKSILRNKYASDLIVNYSNDGTKLNNIQKDCSYAVFVNYIEIYNNIVYDLMDDTYGTKLQQKILREDSMHNMYVNGVVELEVKSAQEAFELFNIGQKRKRMAHTSMNTESSRSHSIFTIRLVQGIFDSAGEHLVSHEDSLVVAQLSLVDLAGSERCSRTQTSGQRLKEAGAINNSLMSLRTCLEILRENQLNGGNRIVPYRDSRLTHLFKNFFDGEGKVEMIVCVNPSINDYDETVQVMKFAEITQEVKITRPEAKNLHIEDVDNGKHRIKNKSQEIIPRQLFHSQRFKSLIKKNSLPTNYINMPEPDVLDTFLMYLKLHMEKRQERKKRVFRKCDQFRKKLAKTHKNNVVLKLEIQSLNNIIKKRRDVVEKTQSEKLNMQVAYEKVVKECEEKDRLIEELQDTVMEKNFKLNQNIINKEEEKRKLEEKMTQEFDAKIRYQRDLLTAAMKHETEKIELVKDILMNQPVSSTKSDLQSVKSQQLLSTVEKPNTEDDLITEPTSSHLSRKTAPVSNVRYRRSRSAGDVWLEHRPVNPIPLGTVLQPVIKRRKSVTKLTNVKDIICSKQSKYLLIDQGQDNIGDLETKFYKADIIPTCSGGAQIIFDDVERLKQESPTDSSKKQNLKRSYLNMSDLEFSDKKPRQ